jgi:hypothetical protein
LTACRRIEDKRYITEKKNRFERLTRDDWDINRNKVF